MPVPLVVRPLSPFGAEVDVNLGAGLDAPTRGMLRVALDHQSLLVFRDQDLTFEDQRQVLETFGPVLVDDPHQLGYTYVTNVGPGAAAVPRVRPLAAGRGRRHCPMMARWPEVMSGTGGS